MLIMEHLGSSQNDITKHIVFEKLNLEGEMCSQGKNEEARQISLKYYNYGNRGHFSHEYIEHKKVEIYPKFLLNCFFTSRVMMAHSLSDYI